MHIMQEIKVGDINYNVTLLVGNSCIIALCLTYIDSFLWFFSPVSQLDVTVYKPIT